MPHEPHSGRLRLSQPQQSAPGAEAAGATRCSPTSPALPLQSFHAAGQSISAYVSGWKHRETDDRSCDSLHRGGLCRAGTVWRFDGWSRIPLPAHTFRPHDATVAPSPARCRAPSMPLGLQACLLLSSRFVADHVHVLAICSAEGADNRFRRDPVARNNARCLERPLQGRRAGCVVRAHAGQLSRRARCPGQSQACHATDRTQHARWVELQLKRTSGLYCLRSCTARRIHSLGLSPVQMPPSVSSVQMNSHSCVLLLFAA